MSIKNLLVSLTPPILISTLKSVRKGLQRTPVKVTQLEKIHIYNNRDSQPEEIVIREGIKVKVHPTCRESFEYFCFRSPDSVEELDLFLKRTYGKTKLLDIGSLHGIFSLAFTAGFPERVALAVDASPMAFPKLLYNIHRNAPQRIQAAEYAISNSAGVLKMHYEWEHAVANGKSDGKKLISVDKITGDQLCKERGFEPDVIKIDVEGHEVKVCKGLASTISTFRPLIFLEIHPARIKDENELLSELLDFLGNLDYSATRTDERPITFDENAKTEEDIRILFGPTPAI